MQENFLMENIRHLYTSKLNIWMEILGHVLEFLMYFGSFKKGYV